MPQQTGTNVVVAYKVEGSFNTAPGDTGAKQLRLTASPGMSLQRAEIQSAEVASDGLMPDVRYGSSSAPGTYSSELSLGSFDEIFEAIMRSTWVAAVTVTFDNGAALTSVEVTGTNQLTFAGTTVPTAFGLRVGDAFRLTNMSTAANNNVTCRVKSIATSVVTLEDSNLTIQGADTACVLTILKKLKNGATPTRRTFYVQEHMVDNDISEVFGGCRWVSMELSGSPDGMANLTIGVLGASATGLASGSSPYYTSPTQYTTIPLVFVDAAISFAGTAVSTLTAFTIRWEIPAETLPVIGSTVTPDVFDNQLGISGSFSVLKADATNLNRLKNETEFEISVKLVEPDASDPIDCMVFYLPRVKVGTASKQLGSNGALVETVPFRALRKAAATGYDATLCTISSSAA